MMIHGCASISTENRDEFYMELIKTIRDFQSKGQELEVQYQATQSRNGKITYSVLILGRK